MRIRTLILTILLFSSFANCLVVDGLGLTNTYSGDEAKKKILDAAKIGDYQTARAAFAAEGHTGADLESMTLLDVTLASAINNAVMDIDSSKYYKKADVDACAVAVASIGVQLDFDSFTVYSLIPACKLNADGAIVDANYGSDSNSSYKKKN